MHRLMNKNIKYWYYKNMITNFRFKLSNSISYLSLKIGQASQDEGGGARGGGYFIKLLMLSSFRTHSKNVYL